MPHKKDDVSLSRFLSLILRHDSTTAHIQLDENGWANVGELLLGLERAGRKTDMETLERIVQTDSKQRYRFNSDHTKIRASQGHSIRVDVGLQERTPSSVLYHGTAARFLKSIMEKRPHASKTAICSPVCG